jgi:hypothetical protein
MSRYLYKSDEIKAYVNHLADSGATGNSNAYKGISVADEEHLTALLIQATPFMDLPSIHDLDKHQGIYLMIAKFVSTPDGDNAIELADYLKNLFVDYFQGTINRLLEEKRDDSRISETEVQKREKEQDNYLYEKSRL